MCRRIDRILRPLVVAALYACPLALNAAPAAYITNSADNTVSVVDLTSFTVTQTIPVGPTPVGVAVHPSRPRVYVTNHGAGTVSVIDTQFNTVVDTVTVGTAPYNITLDPTGANAYVANDNANYNSSISKIDTATDAQSVFYSNISVIRGLAIDPADTQLFIGRVFFNVLEVANLTGPNLVNFTHSQEAGAAGVTVDASNNVFWADSSSGFIRTQTIGTTNARSLATGQQSASVVAVDNTNVYWTVTSAAGTVMSIVKTATAPSPPPVTLASGLNLPAGIAVDASYVYAAISGGNTLLRIAKSDLSQTSVTVGNAPLAIGNFIGDNSAFTDGSTITVSANPATSAFGQNVALTATIAAGFSGGTVNFCDGGPASDAAFCSGGTALCSGPVSVSGSTATCTTSTLALGTHAITARYNGSGFTSTTPTAASEQVAAAAATTAVTSDANPSVLGQSITFTATVSANAPSTGTPSGTVTFLDGTTTLAAVTLNSSGQAAFSTGSLSIGSHSISVSYSGDTNFVADTSATLSQVVNQAATATALASSVNPSLPGQAVTFTASVSAIAPGAGTPSGTVTFLDGTTTLGSVTLNAGSQATFSTSALSAGSHSITVSYSGATNFSASTSSALPQIVNKTASTMSLSSGSNPSTFGQTVTFTATISGSSSSGSPTGTVTFADGATPLGAGVLNSGGQATFSTSSLNAGSHTITASYPGDANFAASSSTLTQSVNSATTSVVLTSSPNPSTFGQSVTFSVSVNVGQAPTFARTIGAQAMAGAKTGHALAAATGTLTILDGTTTLTTLALGSGGQASYSTSTLAVGTHTITVNYSGDSNNAPSSASINQVVSSAVVGASAIAAPAANSALLSLLALLFAATAIIALRPPED